MGGKLQEEKRRFFGGWMSWRVNGGRRVVIFFELVGEGRLDFEIDQPAKNAEKGKLYDLCGFT